MEVCYRYSKKQYKCYFKQDILKFYSQLKPFRWELTCLQKLLSLPLSESLMDKFLDGLEVVNISKCQVEQVEED